jgi:hypothetical protein
MEYNQRMDSIDEPAPLPCSEKLAFDTKKDAQATATVARYRYGGKLKVYRCRYCNLWHLATDYDD